MHLSFLPSRWCRGCTSSKTSKRPDARRVPSPEQNFVPAEPPRDSHQGPAHGTLLTVCCCVYISFVVYMHSTHSHHRYPNLYEVRLIPTKKDIAFVEFLDEQSATVAKDALHNYKLDGENKIKVCYNDGLMSSPPLTTLYDRSRSRGSSVPAKKQLLFVCRHTYMGGPCLLTVSSLYSGAHAQCIIRAIGIDSPWSRRC